MGGTPRAVELVYHGGEEGRVAERVAGYYRDVVLEFVDQCACVLGVEEDAVAAVEEAHV